MSQPGRSFMLCFLLLVCMSLQLFSQEINEYDKNISKQVGKLRQYPNNEKSMEGLKQDYNFANTADLETINALKATGQPDIWYRIYQANDRIKNRQDMVKTLPVSTIQKMGITFTDNSRELEESRNRATWYSYALAEKMLAENNPASARIAYVELLKVSWLKDGKYRDLDRMMRKAILVGSASVEFELYNRSGKKLTSDIVGRLNQLVVDYKTLKFQQVAGEETEVPFKFTVRVVIDEVTVSPDQIKGLTYGEERDVYDSQGQVTDTISCQVNEYRQLKKATMSGRIDFYDNQVGRVVNVVPIKVESVFTNAFGTLKGNPDAAGETTRLLLSSSQAEYPTAEQMVLDATDEFVKKSAEVILAE